MKQVLVIHGGDFFDTRKEFLDALKKEKPSKEDFLRTDEQRWKDNLAHDLGKGFEVLRPEMPNAGDAKYGEWKVWFEKVIPFLSDGIILVGHSLGGIFLARYLSEHVFPKKIQGLFLVAAPFFKSDKKRGVGANAGFSVSTDVKNIGKRTNNIFIYHSSDDSIVPLRHAKIYSKLLPTAKFTEFKNKGHFRQEHFPELVKDIKGLSQQSGN